MTCSQYIPPAKFGDNDGQTKPAKKEAEKKAKDQKIQRSIERGQSRKWARAELAGANARGPRSGRAWDSRRRLKEVPTGGQADKLRVRRRGRRRRRRRSKREDSGDDDDGGRWEGMPRVMRFARGRLSYKDGSAGRAAAAQEGREGVRQQQHKQHKQHKAAASSSSKQYWQTKL